MKRKLESGTDLGADDARTALRIAQELQEDGDGDAAQRCAQYAVNLARATGAAPFDAPAVKGTWT